MDTYTTFTTTVTCNEKITGKGNAKFISADYETNPCDLNVKLEHSCGCGSKSFKMDKRGFNQLLNFDDPWYAAAVFLSGGKIIFVGLVSILAR